MRERPTIILLHGGPGFDHTPYKQLYAPLTQIAQLVYYDHRGNGRSESGSRERWTLDQWADDLRTLCDVLGIERPIVFGGSFGGFVALNYALMRVAGIPLDLGTAMTGAIALGIAVDNTFHFIESWRKRGAEATGATTGRAMIVTSLVIGAGFLSLILSDFGPTRNFGVLTSVVMVTALIGVIFVLTPLLDLLSQSEK